MSVASRNVKAISGHEDGFSVTPLRTMIDHPDRLQALLEQNPLYDKAIVSGDQRLFAIIVGFEPDPLGYGTILRRVAPLIDRERDSSVSIYLSGHVNFLGEIEIYSERMIIFVPVAVVLIALLLFDAFRSLQGLFLPLLTANLALIWVLGVMGASGIPLDVFNATTPILILAIAAGHAVQILKRYYEEYDRLRMDGLSSVEANHAAVVVSIDKVGRFMIAASLVAAAGFLSLTIFEIRTVRTFGIFTGVGIINALLIELTFMPALRSWLQPPPWPRPIRSGHAVWDTIIARLVAWSPTRKPFIVWGMVVAAALVGASRIQVENSNKANFADWTTVRQDDAIINHNLAGTQIFYILIDAGQEGGIKRPDVLRGMDILQQQLGQLPGVGKTLSIVDFLKRMNRAMHADQQEADTLPTTAEMAGQYLLLYSMSGDPDDLKSYIDADDQRATIKVYVQRDDSPFILNLVARTQQLAQSALPDSVTVRFGGGVAEAAALNEVMVRDKLLNMLQITTVVFMASALVFRSFVAGVLVLTPLLIAVTVNFGLLGWLGIPLNIPTSLISAMSVGIGADYAIYLLSRYREELHRHAAEGGVVARTLNSAGRACLYVATSVAIGYGVLGLSLGFKVHQWLALLIASAMFVSVFAALSLIPALLEQFQPRFMFGNTVTERK
ncbi:MAG: MMPL family transporter [Magnetococcales bacterium]|nr:MMPL family transporter [Magnetococcales bacterium]